MRFVVARRMGRRGAGFGNEAISWAKGWIASQVLDARMIGPSWGLSRYRYDRHFGTSRFDFIAEEMLRHFPHYVFTEADYRATGEIEFGAAIGHWAEKLGLLARRSFVVIVEGMWGGYPAIRHARLFLLSRILNSRGALRHAGEVLSTTHRRKLFVTLHFRGAGEFKSAIAGESMRGQFNVRVPVDWYHRVGERLQARFGDQVQFHILTDREGPDFDALVARFNPGQIRQRGLTEMSDLLLMTQADLRVCSVSSYSMLASFLAEGPYLWYEPQLGIIDGIYSMWGHEETQRSPGDTTFENIIKVSHMPSNKAHATSLRGYPVGQDGDLSLGLIDQLQHRLDVKDPTTDLLQYGVVPAVMLAAK